MTAVETLFDYLRTIREAKKYISNKGENLSTDDMIALTSLARHLSTLEPDTTDILAIEVERNYPSDETLARIKRKVLSECASFTDLYLKKQECFDKLCSFESVCNLINDKVESEFALSKKATKEEVVKWNNIFRKCNDITRIYNSMDCRPGQEEADMRIINEYKEELYDMIGHPINLEKIHDEHEAIRSTLRLKEKEQNEIADKIRARCYELSEMIDSDVLYSISSYAESLAKAFSSEEEIPSQDTTKISTPEPEMSGMDQMTSLSAPKQKRGRGRPTKKERYASAGITDLKSCFTNESYYNLVVSEIEKEPVNSIGGDVSYCIVNCLFKSGYLKNEVKSTGDLAKFLINEFPKQYHISSGVSSYDNKIDAEKEQDWKRRLSRDKIKD